MVVYVATNKGTTDDNWNQKQDTKRDQYYDRQHPP